MDQSAWRYCCAHRCETAAHACMLSMTVFTTQCRGVIDTRPLKMTCRIEYNRVKDKTKERSSVVKEIVTESNSVCKHV